MKKNEWFSRNRFTPLSFHKDHPPVLESTLFYHPSLECLAIKVTLIVAIIKIMNDPQITAVSQAFFRIPNLTILIITTIKGTSNCWKSGWALKRLGRSSLADIYFSNHTILTNKIIAVILKLDPNQTFKKFRVGLTQDLNNLTFKLVNL